MPLSLAPSLGLGLQRAGAAATPAPVVLPTAVAPSAVWLIKQPGWAGFSMTVIDGLSNTVDIGWQADNTPDAVQLAALTTPIYPTTYYDTTGNGFHITFPVAAQRPQIWTTNNYRGKVQASFSPIWNDQSLAAHVQYGDIPAMASLNRATFAFFGVYAPVCSIRAANLASFWNGAATQVQLQISGTPSEGFKETSLGATSGEIARSQPAVFGYLSNATNRVFYIKERAITAAATTTSAMASGGKLGALVSNVNTAPMPCGFFGAAMYNLAVVGAMTQAQGQAVYDALQSGYEVVTNSNRTGIWIDCGDSLNVGASTSNGDLRTAHVIAQSYLHGRIECYDPAIVGETLQTQAALSPTTAERILNSTGITGYVGTVVVTNEYGTNDVGSGARTSAQVATDQATWQGKVKAVRAAAKCVYLAIPARDDTVANIGAGTWTAGKETQALAVNVNRAALSGSADGYINTRSVTGMTGPADVTSAPGVATVCYLLPGTATDFLHWSATGHARQGALRGPAVDAFFP